MPVMRSDIEGGGGCEADSFSVLRADGPHPETSSHPASSAHNGAARCFDGLLILDAAAKRLHVRCLRRVACEHGVDGVAEVLFCNIRFILVVVDGPNVSQVALAIEQEDVRRYGRSVIATGLLRGV